MPEESLLNSVQDIPLEGQLRMEVRNLVEQVLILHRYNVK